MPTAEREKDTLLSRVSLYLQHRYRRRPYVGVVHRLDRETSGALVFARTREALRFLQQRFREHDDRARVRGDRRRRAPPEPASSTRRSRATADRAARGRARRASGAGAPLTRYRVLESLSGREPRRVELETGRTHQIRIHFAAAGHPVLGDRVYRAAELLRTRGGLSAPARQMLHARRLGIPHPRTAGFVRVDSPIPEDFAQVAAALPSGPGAPEKKSAPGRPGRSG